MGGMGSWTSFSILDVEAQDKIRDIDDSTHYQQSLLTAEGMIYAQKPVSAYGLPFTESSEFQ